MTNCSLNSTFHIIRNICSVVVQGRLFLPKTMTYIEEATEVSMTMILFSAEFFVVLISLNSQEILSEVFDCFHLISFFSNLFRSVVIPCSLTTSAQGQPPFFRTPRILFQIRLVFEYPDVMRSSWYTLFLNDSFVWNRLCTSFWK